MSPPIERFSATVRSANTLASCGTYASPAEASRCGCHGVTSVPSKESEPPVMGSSRARVFSSVLFPAPLAPRTAKISWSREKLMPLRTVTSP